MPENNANNQRVTNAQLKNDIDHLSQRVEEMRNELREESASTTKRLKTVEDHVIKCSTLWIKHDIEHTRIEGDLSDVKTDVKKWSGVSGLVGGIGAVLASIFMDR